MIHSDKQQFKEVLDGMCEMYQKDKLSKMALQLYFGSLEKYSIDQVMGAISQHVTDPKHGTFLPKVADIVRHIEGGEITTDEVLSAARLKSTPFGILCRIQIGTYDLEHQTDMFYLKQRAQECLDLLPEWKRKAADGDYTDHEVSIMLKHSVSPCAPFRAGLQSPKNLPLLQSRVNEIVKTDRYKFLIEAPYKEEDGDKLLIVDSSVKDFLSKID